MKKLLLLSFVAAIAFATTVKAQTQFNHLALYVVDLNKSTSFYKDVMQLEQIPEPFHDNRHSWFKISEHGQLHIISGAAQTAPHDINVHLSFSVPSVEVFAKHLDALNVKYGNWNLSSKSPQVRADGIKQIYLQDPDGYWIEVNDDKF